MKTRKTANEGRQDQQSRRAGGVLPGIHCPVCAGSEVRTAIEVQAFLYGEDPNATELSARVPVRTCDSCGFQFTDFEAEQARHEAICRHLGVMTPAEVAEIRKRYRFSQAELARLTRIGEASLSRWENGQLIQNAAYDQFLYLLTFPENVERLRARSAESRRTSVPTRAPSARARRPGKTRGHRHMGPLRAGGPAAG
ncbi:MAG: type II toxin-antitoxin system MqsA family antitoxin [bacterium]|nr:type II toxin-antitoxin system MqsA family antitoxin [bacterium]